MAADRTNSFPSLALRAHGRLPTNAKVPLNLAGQGLHESESCSAGVGLRDDSCATISPVGDFTVSRGPG